MEIKSCNVSVRDGAHCSVLKMRMQTGRADLKKQLRCEGLCYCSPKGSEERNWKVVNSTGRYILLRPSYQLIYACRTSYHQFLMKASPLGLDFEASFWPENGWGIHFPLFRGCGKVDSPTQTRPLTRPTTVRGKQML